MNEKEIGEKLKQIRKNLNLTQAKMAERLNCQQQASYISKYESGNLKPSLEVLISYSYVANCSLDYLILDKERGLPRGLQHSMTGLTEKEKEYVFGIANQAATGLKKLNLQNKQ